MITKFNKDLLECPKCKADWDGGDIAEELFKTGHYKTVNDAEKAAKSYGWTPKNKLRGRKYIGIEVQGEYDGISYWKCPECETHWDRFTGKETKRFNKNDK